MYIVASVLMKTVSPRDCEIPGSSVGGFVSQLAICSAPSVNTIEGDLITLEQLMLPFFLGKQQECHPNFLRNTMFQ